MSVARKVLIVELALGATALVGCSSPPQTAGAPPAAARRDATLAAPSAPAAVMIAFQPAQMCPSPRACLQGSELAWVPPGTSLDVHALHVEELPRSQVHWFRVEYEDKPGWISEFSTDKAPRVSGGKIIRE